MALLHQFLNVVLKAIHQITVEFVFPIVLANYCAQFAIRDFFNTFTCIINFTSLKLVF